MNERSAYMYILTFLDMITGNGYKRTINEYGTRYFLENIYKDYGVMALLKAISSVRKHLESNRNSQYNIKIILQEFTEKIKDLASYKDFQENFNKQIELSLNDTSADRLVRLKNTEQTPKTIEAEFV